MRLEFLLLASLLLVSLSGCGSGDSAGTAPAGPLAVPGAAAAALQQNSPQQVNALFDSNYSYVGRAAQNAASNLVAGITYQNISFQVQSYVPLSTTSGELVVSGQFSGMWQPGGFNPIPSPAPGGVPPTSGPVPPAIPVSGHETLWWRLAQGSSGAWQITGQRVISRDIFTTAANLQASNVQINHLAGPAIAPGTSLHITGSILRAGGVITSLVVSGDAAGASQQSLHLENQQQQFSADVLAATSPGENIVTILALNLDSSARPLALHQEERPYLVKE